MDHEESENGRSRVCKLTRVSKTPRAVGPENHWLEEDRKEEADWKCMDLPARASMPEAAFPGSIDQ